jgi:cation-transporting P-type ATPase
MDTLNNNLLNTNTTSGLNDEEVSLRQKQFGKNKFEDKKKKNPFLVYLSQFKDVLVIILLCATFFSFAMAIVQGVHSK